MVQKSYIKIYLCLLHFLRCPIIHVPYIMMDWLMNLSFLWLYKNRGIWSKLNATEQSTNFEESCSFISSMHNWEEGDGWWCEGLEKKSEGWIGWCIFIYKLIYSCIWIMILLITCIKININIHFSSLVQLRKDILMYIFNMTVSR